MPSLFQSTLNTRLLPTGTLRFIRSDCPQNLTEEEIEWLRHNRVTTIVDFTVYHMPVTGGGDTPKSPDAVASVYLGMLDEQMDNIIQTILDAKSNVLYFCGAGKDRTGVVSAILLKKLGFDDQTIIDDYMKTKDNLLDFLTNYVHQHPQVNINTILPNEANIRKVLDTLS